MISNAERSLTSRSLTSRSLATRSLPRHTLVRRSASRHSLARRSVTRPLARRSVVGPLAATLAIVTALAGCSGGDSEPADTTTDTASAAATTETTTTPAPEVVTAEGPCPYLDLQLVKETIGQNLTTSIVTTTTPAPGPGPKCEFQRPNSEIAAITDTLTAADPATAQQTALAFAPGGNPVKAGEGGSVLVKAGEAQTVLAAYRGTTVVFVTINQESSLEATLLAEQMFAALP